MNSTKKKLKYRFRIHNLDELNKCLKFIKNRRFDVLWSDCDIDVYNAKSNDPRIALPSVNSFLIDVEERQDTDFMITCYFNCDYKLMQFHKKIKKELPEWGCGNDNCSRIDCPYFIDNVSKDTPIEWIWRCILADEGRI